MARGMQWDKAAKLDKRGAEHKEIIPVKIDQAFSRAWRDGPEAMKASGYRVIKTATG